MEIKKTEIPKSESGDITLPQSGAIPVPFFPANNNSFEFTFSIKMYSVTSVTPPLMDSFIRGQKYRKKIDYFQNFLLIQVEVL